MIIKTQSKVICTHCGLDVPSGLIQPERKNQFCCGGCEGAFALISGSGLESFYAIADQKSLQESVLERVVEDSEFCEFNEPVFYEKFVCEFTNGSREVDLSIDGVHCGACVWLIEKLPSILPGVENATVNWPRRTVRVRWKNAIVSISVIAETLHRLGYRPHPIHVGENQLRERKQNRQHLTQIGIAAACAGNNMILSAALYFGMFSHMTAGMSQLMRIASCVVGVFALLGPGQTFLRSALNAVRTWTPHMDLPIALGLSVGTLAGLINVIRGAGEIYFDSLSVLIFLLLIGRWIQFRQQNKAANAIELLYRLTPAKTRKMIDGHAQATLVDLVQPNDVLEIRPGDVVPVDGTVVDGSTRIDEAVLTGESQPVLKLAGASVMAGTINTDSKILVKTQSIGRTTRLGKIVDLVEQASLDKPAVVLWANRIGGYFVLTVIALAAITLACWWHIDAETAVERTIALLIVACPCALALATPLAIAVALGRSAGKKVMVKGGDVLQSLQSPGTIWLDKTGTLTEGNLKVERWFGDTMRADVVAALEQASSHPIASALVDFANDCWSPKKDQSLSTPNHTVGDFRCLVEKAVEYRGLGIKGTVGGRTVLVGNRQLLTDQGVTPSKHQQRIAETIADGGLSPCWISMDNVVVAVVAIGDSIRPEASAAITSLRHRGWKIGVLSGDHQSVVDRVAQRLQIPSNLAMGEMSPEEKLAVIKKQPDNATVIMVGDGVNDSAALAAASVGIAVKNGAEASLAAANVYLAEPGLNPILRLFAISDSTAKTMQVNLAVSLAYNITFAALAFFGFINPLVAAILMPISSLTVVALSLRAGNSDSINVMQS
jgi:Cu2+-exporting ATPase